jgi:type VI protein secretion system component VasK
MIVAVRDLASGMSSLSQAMWELYDEFRFKEFYKRDAPPPPARASATRAPAKKASAAKRKKPPAAAAKKRRK